MNKKTHWILALLLALVLILTGAAFAEDCTNEYGHEDYEGDDCICDFCGAPYHAAGRTQEIQNPEYARFDANRHSVTGKNVWVWKCACGDINEVNVIDEEGTMYESHDEDGENGACSKCGFKRADPETCEHEFLNGSCGECIYCGEWIHEVVDCVCIYECGYDEHDRDENCMCVNCGGIWHDDWSLRTQVIFENAEYAPYNNYDHYVSGDARVVTICSDCGCIDNEIVELGYLENVLENHDEWDSCEKCGFVRSEEEVDPETCPHTNLDIWQDCEGSLVAVDNRYEYYHGDVYEYRYCMDCETELEATLIGEDMDYVQEHGMRSFENEFDLECGNCGLKASCTHDGEFETVVYTNIGRYHWDNANKHCFEGQVCKMEVCSECGWESSEFKYEYDYIYQDHTFEEGECIYCGGVDPETCAHEYDEYGQCEICGHCLHLILRDDSYDPIDEEYDYELIDSVYHWRIGVPVKRMICDYCYEVIESEVLETAYMRERHKFYDEEWEESDTCRDCGYTKNSECAHENTVEGKVWLDTDWYEVEPEFVKSDAEGHHIVYAKLQDIFCADCGEYLESKQVGTESVIEPHNFYSKDETCCYCWSYWDEELNQPVEITYTPECPHENMELVKESYEEAAEYANSNDGGMWWGVFYPVDETNHILYKAIWYYNECPDCGLIVDRFDLTEPHGSYTAPHTMEDGYCIYCKYAQNGEVIPDFELDAATTLVLPADLKEIHEAAFAYCKAESVIIQSGCETIGKQAFYGSESLKYVEIPASVTAIADDAFDGCDDVVIYAPAGSKAIAVAKANGIPTVEK